MTDQWKDRIIRGGAIAVMTVAALGCMVWLTSIMAGYPAAPLRSKRARRVKTGRPNQGSYFARKSHA